MPFPDPGLVAFLDVEYQRGCWARVTATPDGAGGLDLVARGDDGRAVTLTEDVEFRCRVRFSRAYEKEVARNARVHEHR